MNPFTLIDRLDRAGVVLAVNGEKLRWSALPGRMTPDLLEAMKDAKPILLALLQQDWYGAAIAMIDRLDNPDRRADLRYQFEERASICEYDGGLSRQDAERIALDQVAAELDLLEIQQSEDRP